MPCPVAYGFKQILFNETEKLLEKWKHPDPYRPPSAPGGREDQSVKNAIQLTTFTGSKYERNVPAPDLPPPDQSFVKSL